MQETVGKRGEVITEQPIVKKVLYFTLILLCVIGMQMLFHR